MAQHQGQPLLSQNVVFTPQSVGMSAADIELGKLTKNFIPIRKKGKDTTILVINLSNGRTVHQLPAEALDLQRGALTSDGSTFGWIKSKAFTGSAFKTVSTTDKAKSVSFNVGADASCNWYNISPTKGPYAPTVFIVDPYKRLVYTWKTSDITKSPPTKLFPWSSPFPEGSTAKAVGGIQHTSDGSYFAFTEWMQWPPIRAHAPNFWAGMARLYDASSKDHRDVWAQACAFAERTMKLFVFAERLRPGDKMFLRITEPSFDVQFQGITVEIPNDDPFEVPRHIHIFESARLAGVITTNGAIHVFELRSGDLVWSDRIMNFAPNRDADFSVGDEAGKVLLVRTGQSVVRIDLNQA